MALMWRPVLSRHETEVFANGSNRIDPEAMRADCETIRPSTKAVGFLAESCKPESVSVDAVINKDRRYIPGIHHFGSCRHDAPRTS